MNEYEPAASGPAGVEPSARPLALSRWEPAGAPLGVHVPFVKNVNVTLPVGATPVTPEAFAVSWTVEPAVTDLLVTSVVPNRTLVVKLESEPVLTVNGSQSPVFGS